MLESRAQNAEAGGAHAAEAESLPSYTIVSGLPSYEEALEQLRKVNELRTDSKTVEINAQSCEVTNAYSTDNRQQPLSKLSATELLQTYKPYPQ